MLNGETGGRVPPIPEPSSLSSLLMPDELDALNTSNQVNPNQQSSNVEQSTPQNATTPVSPEPPPVISAPQQNEQQQPLVLQAPEDPETREKERKIVQGEVQQVARRMIATETFSPQTPDYKNLSRKQKKEYKKNPPPEPTPAEPDLVRIELLRELTPENFKPEDYAQGGALEPILIRLPDARGRERATHITAVTGVQRNEDGSIEVIAHCKVQNIGTNGRPIRDSFTESTQTISLQDVIDGQIYAAADSLRAYYAKSPEQSRLLEAHLTLLQEKIAPADPRLVEALSNNVSDEDIVRLGFTPAAISAERERQKVFADENLDELRKVINTEAENNGTLTVKDFDRYIKARKGQLASKETGRLSEQAQGEIDELAQMSQQIKDTGRTLLQARDIVDLVHKDIIAKTDTTGMQQHMEDVSQQIKQLNEQFATTKDENQLQALQNSIQQLHDTQSMLQACQQFVENPDMLEGQLEGFWNMYTDGSIDRATARGIRNALQSGNIDSAMERIMNHQQGEQTVNWKRRLALRRNLTQTMNKATMAGGIVMLFLIMSSMGITKE
ncbi:MAG TPA: hypothetical protein VGT05_03240 [Patescibacteria group bacterium]|nr:hypothetical protein [Patescibacteria group bacterium]